MTKNSEESSEPPRASRPVPRQLNGWHIVLKIQETTRRGGAKGPLESAQGRQVRVQRFLLLRGVGSSSRVGIIAPGNRNVPSRKTEPTSKRSQPLESGLYIVRCPGPGEGASPLSTCNPANAKSEQTRQRANAHPCAIQRREGTTMTWATLQEGNAGKRWTRRYPGRSWLKPGVSPSGYDLRQQEP